MVEVIRARAQAKGLSIYALERKAGVGNGAIARWDVSAPRLDNLQKVADALECSVVELLAESQTA